MEVGAVLVWSVERAEAIRTPIQGGCRDIKHAADFPDPEPRTGGDDFYDGVEIFKLLDSRSVL